ncbi:Protein CBG24253, partial [Caenorhabditis briggsae]
KFRNSEIQKFRIAEKLRSIEESVSKIPKFEEKPKSAKEFVLKHVFNKVVEFEEDDVHFNDTVSGILHLSDMYDAPTAIRRCEELLLKNSHLKNKCLSEITTISDIQLIVSLNFKEMDLSTSQSLLQKSLEFSNK